MHMNYILLLIPQQLWELADKLDLWRHLQNMLLKQVLPNIFFNGCQGVTNESLCNCLKTSTAKDN